MRAHGGRAEKRNAFGAKRRRRNQPPTRPSPEKIPRRRIALAQGDSKLHKDLMKRKSAARARRHGESPRENHQARITQAMCKEGMALRGPGNARGSTSSL